jgi:hypothetical protein
MPSFAASLDKLLLSLIIATNAITNDEQDGPRSAPKLSDGRRTLEGVKLLDDRMYEDLHM